MKTLLESTEFQGELPGWILRGVLCAANSACWAAVTGFTHPMEIAGMALGVAFWVALFTGYCAWSLRTAPVARGRLVAALKTATWIKIILVVLGLPALFGSRFLPEWLMLSFFGFSVDMLLGFVSLQAVAWLAGLADFTRIAQLDSWSWTALATVFEGTLMTILLGLLAFVVLAWRRYSPGLLSPIRHSD